MNDWFAVKTFPLDVNLQPVLALLQQNNLACRVTEEPSGQCLWVSQANAVEDLKAWLTQPEIVEWLHNQEGSAPSSEASLLPNMGQNGFALLRLLWRYPITLLTLILGLCGAALVHWDTQGTYLAWLTYQPIEVVGSQLRLYDAQAGWQLGQYWRFITPIFLHFDILHITFNALWIWEFGRRIETRFGHFTLLSSIVAIGVISNSAQYWWSGPTLFGGLSGVLYGLLGILWISHRLRPHPATDLPKGIVIFMLLWMALCMTGTVTALFGMGIANGAHFGGFLAGVLIAYLFYAWDTLWPKRTDSSL